MHVAPDNGSTELFKLSENSREFVTVDLNTILEDVINDFEFQIFEKKATIHTTRLPVVKGISVQLSQLFYPYRQFIEIRRCRPCNYHII